MTASASAIAGRVARLSGLQLQIAKAAFALFFLFPFSFFFFVLFLHHWTLVIKVVQKRPLWSQAQRLLFYMRISLGYNNAYSKCQILIKQDQPH